MIGRGGWAAPLVGLLVFVASGCGARPAPSPVAAPPAPAAAQPAPGAYHPTPLAPRVPVRVAVIGGASDAGIYVAADKAYFADEGLDVDIVEFSNTAAMIPALG